MLAPTTNEACDAAYQSLLTRLDKQQAQIGALQEQLRKTEQDRDEYRKLLLLLRAQNESLKRGLLGQKAERLPTNDAQLTMEVHRHGPTAVTDCGLLYLAARCYDCDNPAKSGPGSGTMKRS